MAPPPCAQDIHGSVAPEEVELVRRDYAANGGWETFLAYEDPRQDILVGLLRLRRLPKRASIVRELHVYGAAVAVHARDASKHQHQVRRASQLVQCNLIMTIYCSVILFILRATSNKRTFKFKNVNIFKKNSDLVYSYIHNHIMLTRHKIGLGRLLICARWVVLAADGGVGRACAGLRDAAAGGGRAHRARGAPQRAPGGHQRRGHAPLLPQAGLPPGGHLHGQGPAPSFQAAARRARRPARGRTSAFLVQREVQYGRCVVLLGHCLEWSALDVGTM